MEEGGDSHGVFLKNSNAMGNDCVFRKKKK